MAGGFVINGEDQAKKTKQPRKNVEEDLDFNNFLGPQTIFKTAIGTLLLFSP